MNIEEGIKSLQSLAVMLEQQLPDPERFDWDNAPIICQLNGFEYRLGPESPNELNWDDAINWCKSVGGELPSREVLLVCYVNENISINFKEEYYWSSTEFFTAYAWGQYFSNGSQKYDGKNNTFCVRAVRRFAIS